MENEGPEDPSNFLRDSGPAVSKEKQQDSVWIDALRILNRRQMSSNMLAEELARKEHSNEYITPCIAQLQKDNLLNDISFCYQLSNYYIERRPHSKTELLKKLSRFQFAFPYIQQALQNIESEYRVGEMTLPYKMQNRKVSVFFEENDIWLDLTLFAAYEVWTKNPAQRQSGIEEEHRIIAVLQLRGYDPYNIEKVIIRLRDF